MNVDNIDKSYLFLVFTTHLKELQQFNDKNTVISISERTPLADYNNAPDYITTAQSASPCPCKYTSQVTDKCCTLTLKYSGTHSKVQLATPLEGG